MGRPVGNKTYVSEMCNQKMEGYLIDIDHLPKLDVQSAFIILRDCILARPTYLARVVELEEARTALMSADVKVTACIATLIHACSDIEKQKIGAIRRLPADLGGLGLRSFSGVNRDKGLIRSRRLSDTFYQTHLASTWEHLRPDMQYVTTPLEDWISNAILHRANEYDPTDLMDLDKAVGFVLAENQQSIRSRLEPLDAIWLKGNSYKGSLKWFNWFGDWDYMYRWSKDEYIAAIRMRLLLPIMSSIPQTLRLTCDCNQRVDLTAKPYHCLDCQHPHHNTYRIHRHHGIRDSIKILLSKVGEEVRAEVEVPGMGDMYDDDHFDAERPLIPEKRTVADVMMRSGDQCVFYDVAVTNPTSPTVVQSGKDALERMYESKCAKYAGMPAPLGFIPVVFSATGQMEPTALEHFNSLICYETMNQSFDKSSAFRRINFIINRYNALMRLRAGKLLARPIQLSQDSSIRRNLIQIRDSINTTQPSPQARDPALPRLGTPLPSLLTVSPAILEDTQDEDSPPPLIPLSASNWFDLGAEETKGESPYHGHNFRSPDF
jgi:hypothetical protein